MDILGERTNVPEEACEYCFEFLEQIADCEVGNHLDVDPAIELG